MAIKPIHKNITVKYATAYADDVMFRLLYPVMTGATNKRTCKPDACTGRVHNLLS